MRRIYFAGDHDDETYVKIGSTGDPKRRLSQFRTARPRMYLIATMPGTSSDEEWTRKRFKRWHVMKETYRGIPHQTIREFSEIARRFAAEDVSLTTQMILPFMRPDDRQMEKSA